MAMSAITVLGQVALQVLKLCNKCCKEKENDGEDKKEGDQNVKDDDVQEDDDEISDNNKDEKESEPESEPEEKKESESEPKENKESALMNKKKRTANKKRSNACSEDENESESESEPEKKKESAPMNKKKRTANKKRSTKNKRSNACSEDENESESESEPEEKKESEPMNKTKRTAKKKRSNACSDMEPVTTQPFAIQTTINPVFYNNFQPHCSNPSPGAIAPGVPPWVLPNCTASATTDQNVVKWENTSIDNAIEFMDTAIVGGYDIDETDLWIIRARFKCEVIPGKLNYFHKLAFIAYKTQEGYVEKNIDYFEVLCIAPESRSRIRWTPCSNGVAPNKALEAGRKASGEKLYIGRAIQEDQKYPGRHSLCPGMVQPSHGVLYVTYGFKVYAHKCYEVLCIDD